MTEYRDIAGFPGYRVGSDGTVWSARKRGTNGSTRGTLGEWKPVALYRRTEGAKYIVVCMRAIPGGKVYTRYVHRLVLEAFVGPCPDGMEARHFPDRDTSNNQLANLSWATHKTNIQDKIPQGTYREGENAANANRTAEDILAVHTLRAGGMKQSAIGKIIGMSQSDVSRVLRGASWRSITSSLEEQGLRAPRFNLCYKLSDSQRESVRRDWLSGKYSQPEIAKKYGIVQQSVSRIVTTQKR